MSHLWRTQLLISLNKMWNVGRLLRRGQRTDLFGQVRGHDVTLLLLLLVLFVNGRRPEQGALAATRIWFEGVLPAEGEWSPGQGPLKTFSSQLKFTKLQVDQCDETILSRQVTSTIHRWNYVQALYLTLCVFCTFIVTCSLISKVRISCVSLVL